MTVAADIEAELLAALVLNKLRGGLQVVAVRAPGFGDQRTAMLDDRAVLTGGQAMSEEVGVSLGTITLDRLATAERVRIPRDDTTIGGGGVRLALQDAASIGGLLITTEAMIAGKTENGAQSGVDTEGPGSGRAWPATAGRPGSDQISRTLPTLRRPN